MYYVLTIVLMILNAYAAMLNFHVGNYLVAILNVAAGSFLGWATYNRYKRELKNESKLSSL